MTAAAMTVGIIGTTNSGLVESGQVKLYLSGFMSVHLVYWYRLPVELDSENGVGVGVVADLGPLLEVAHLELAGRGQRDHGDQAAAEEALHKARVLCRIAVDLLECVDAAQRKQAVAGFTADG